MIESKLLDFINDPYDLKVNLSLGYAYEKENQYASAISHYMRGAEYGLDNIVSDKYGLISECLLRAAEVFNKLGSRTVSTKSLINHAISVNPQSSHIYLLLSKIHEQEQNWHECNSAATLGICFIDNYSKLTYENKDKEEVLNELLFQKAVSNYHLGRVTKSKLDFEILRKKHGLKKWLYDAINNNLSVIGRAVEYNQISYEKINGVTKLESYSQCLQDVFIANLIGKNRTYLEIGSGDPIKNSNTYLLEKHYGWKGVSIDVDKELVNKFKSTRNNRVILGDARKVDYNLLYLPEVIEYLQVDCEPPIVTLETLYKIPFDKHKFVFITFEHDAYRGEEVRDKSREYLENLGYKILVPNVTFNGKDVFEDWWVHKELIYNYVDKDYLEKYKKLNKDINSILDIFNIKSK